MKDGYFECFICGGKVAIESNDSASNISDLYDDDDPANVYSYCCMNCGCEYEVWEPTLQDKKLFPYWNNDKTD